MKKTTIFGEESFIPEDMVKLITENYNRKIDNIILNETQKTIQVIVPEIEIDKVKLRNWVMLCMKLENIDNSDLVDLATKKKFADKDHRIAVLERGLELACEDVGIVNVITKVLTDDKTTATVDDVAEYYINQAEKELEVEE